MPFHARPVSRAVALLALCTGLAGCQGAGTTAGDGGFVPPCVRAQRPVSMTPPKLEGPLPAGVEGTVRVDFVIERDGRVSQVDVQPAKAGEDAIPVEMERAVADAVAGWRFREPLVRCRGRMEMGLAVSTTTVPAE